MPLLPTNIVNLLAHYLPARTFFVVYGSHTSTTRPITASVPQGSILGPLLYALYTPDVPEPSEAALATFADDTVILASSPNYHEAVEHLQTAVDQLYKWMKWKILLNGDKSINITFTLRPHPYQPVRLASTIIPYQSTVKYLGVHLDIRFTYLHQIHIKWKEVDQRFWNLL